MNQSAIDIQIISLVGAFCCLFAYMGSQLQWMNAKKIVYNLLNLIGGGILAYAALHPFQAGFLVMEGAWALLSLYGLIKSLRNKKFETL